MNTKKKKPIQKFKPPKSLDNWVWGDYTIDTDGQIVTESGNRSGYKCPFPDCQHEGQTKRKDTFRKHMKTHSVDWKIPTMKEKCSFCQKALDPNPQKKKDHHDICRKVNPRNQNNNTEQEIEHSVNENEAEENLKAEIANLNQRCEGEKNEKEKLQADILALTQNMHQVSMSLTVIQNQKEKDTQMFEGALEEEKAKVLQLKELLKNCEDENKAVQNHMEKDIANLQHKYEQKKSEKVNLVRDTNSVTDKLRQVYEEEKIKVFQLRELLKESENRKESEIADLTDNLNQVNLRLADLKIQHEKEKVQVAQLTDLLKQVTQERKTMNTDLRGIKSNLNVANKKLMDQEAFYKEREADMIEQKNRLKDKLEKEQDEKKETISELVLLRQTVLEQASHLKKEKFKLAHSMTLSLKLRGLSEFQVDGPEAVLIGTGTFGDILRAKQNGEYIAIKRSKNVVGIDMITEAEVMCSIDHQNIMKITGFRISPEDMAISMELMDMDLASFMDLKGEEDTNPAWRRRVIKDTCRAVDHIHRLDIIHRDLKPQNFLVKSHPSLTVALADFGICVVGRKAKGYAGTRGYVAPEVLDEETDYDNKIDDFSLGAILYEVVANDALIQDLESYEEAKKPTTRWNLMKVEMQLEARFIEKLLKVNPKNRKTAGFILDKLF